MLIEREIPEQIYLLPRTGFSVSANTEKWRSNYYKYEELTSAEIIEISIQQTAEDMKSFWGEYIKRLPVLPIPVQFGDYHGTRQIITPQYGNQLFIDIASSDERNGSVKDAVNQVNVLLLNAQPETVVVMTSPRDLPGKGFEESQTYVYRVDKNGQLDAITLISDMNLSENAALMERLGVDSPDGAYNSYDQRVESVIRNVAYIPGSRKMDLEDILMHMQIVMGGNNLRKDVTFREARDLIADRQNLLLKDPLVNAIIDDFVLRMRSQIYEINDTTIRILEQEVGKTILRISALTRNQNNRDFVLDQAQQLIDYSAELSYLQTINGCAGGGRSELMSAVFGGNSEGGGGGEHKFVQKCGQCGTPIFTFIPKGYKCHSCNGIFQGC